MNLIKQLGGITTAKTIVGNAPEGTCIVAAKFERIRYYDYELRFWSGQRFKDTDHTLHSLREFNAVVINIKDLSIAIAEYDQQNAVLAQNIEKTDINFDDFLQVHRTPFEHVTYVLVTSQELLNHVMKRDDLVFVGINGQAQTTIFNLEGGRKYAVVQYLPNSNHTPAEKHAVLVHEAVHVWQEVKLAMGEEEASREFEAFSVQRISLDLFSALEKLEAMPI